MASPATIHIERWHGTGPPVETDIEGLDTGMTTSDVDDVTIIDVAHPIPIPALLSGDTNYSYWVCTRLYADTDPDTIIQNIKWYTGGGAADQLGTGTGVVGNTATGYVQATGTPGTTGLELKVANYVTLAGAPSDVFAYIVSAPLSVDGHIDVGSAPAAFGDFVVYQMTVLETATQGATSVVDFHWQYDEY